jgi:hypothetical protein
MNLTLKHALLDRHVPAYVSAIDAGIRNPNKIYKITSGLVKPSEADKEGLARVLNLSVDKLFPEATESVHA